VKPSSGELINGVHHLPLRVYYEDTDMAGIVYYANYLRYFERGRTDYVRCMGVSQQALKSGENPRTFAVRRAEVDYLKPAVLDDALVLKTWVDVLKKASMVMAQEIWREAELITSASFIIACLDENGRPVRLPMEMVQQIHTTSRKV